MLRKFQSSRAKSPVYAVPPGLRVYAVGDVHGCLDQLNQLLDLIETDLKARPSPSKLIFLGDLVDRGPNSAGVLERILNGGLPTDDCVCLTGNHEEAMLECLDGSVSSYGNWLQHGGLQTMESYGVTRQDIFHKSFDLARAMRVLIPPLHGHFLRSFKNMETVGDYVFVHAGIRPGVSMDQQSTRDLRWIRSDFLDNKMDHGAMVVHGHTIVPRVERRRNRIAVDTGCYLSGRLSAVVLEADTVHVIQVRS